MSRVCEICGKGQMTGNTVSHSNIKTKRVSRPNLHKVVVTTNGKTQTVTMCTKCLKTFKAE